MKSQENQIFLVDTSLIAIALTLFFQEDFWGFPNFQLM